MNAFQIRARYSSRDFGFTLLEVLLALGLLVLVSVSAVDWTLSSMKLARSQKTIIDQNATVRSLFLLLDDDVLVFDTFLNDDPPRVLATDGELRIRTRDLGVGPVVHAFHFDRPKQTLVLRTTRIAMGIQSASQKGDSIERPLLFNVKNFEARFDKRARFLDVAIELTDERRVGRRIFVP